MCHTKTNVSEHVDGVQPQVIRRVAVDCVDELLRTVELIIDVTDDCLPMDMWALHQMPHALFPKLLIKSTCGVVGGSFGGSFTAPGAPGNFLTRLDALPSNPCLRCATLRSCNH